MLLNIARGTVEVTRGGALTVDMDLTVNTSHGGGVKLGVGGMFGNYHQVAGFWNRLLSNGMVQYWNDDRWSPIDAATRGSDYTLEYVTDPNSHLRGYTVLTVVPEPAALWPLATTVCVLLSRLRRRG